MNRADSPWFRHHIPGSLRTQYPEGSMYAYLRDTSEPYRHRTAVEFYGKKTSYGSLLKQIDRLATSFAAVGLKKGDFVSVISVNIPQVLVCIYALNRLGIVANMIHPSLSASEMKKCIEDTDSRFVFASDSVLPKLESIIWKDGFAPTVIAAAIQDALPVFKRILYNKNKDRYYCSKKSITWKQFLHLGNKYTGTTPSDAGTGSDAAAVFYSGGTTGIPKGVLVSNFSVNVIATQVRDAYPVEGNVVGVRSLALMPVFHGFGFANCIHSTLVYGYHIYLVPKFDFDAIIQLIFKKKINILPAIPALFEAFSRSEQALTKDLSFLKMLAVSGDSVPVALLEKVNRILKKGGSDAVLAEAYGQSECVSGCCINPYFDYRLGSIGIPWNDIEMKIVVPGTTRAQTDDEHGEICVAGPTLMMGYYKNPDATAVALRKHEDGKIWLHTGDIGYRDRDGYFYYAQRECRMIITAGFNVFPSEIENVIYECDNVKYCCVIGVRDAVVGCRIKAFVAPADIDCDRDTLRETIRKHCAEKTAVYAVPHEIEIRDSLPLSPLGKIDFKALEKEENDNECHTRRHTGNI